MTVRQSWAGPPVLLVLATLATVALTPLLDRDPAVADGALVSAPPARSALPARSAAPSPRSVDRSIPGPAPRAARTAPVPATSAPSTVGVASLHLDPAGPVAAADARRLSRRDDVDLIGWQGAGPHAALLSGLRGWRTARVGAGLAVSWRVPAFGLVSARERGGIAEVVLRQADGRRLTVLDTQLPAGIEDARHFGRWAATPGAGEGRARLRAIARRWSAASTRWTVATGDFSFGARADLRVRTPGGPRRALGRVAASTYELLGSATPATFVPGRRRFDYVWVDRSALRSGAVAVVRQRVLRGYGSAHRPLVATLRLR